MDDKEDVMNALEEFSRNPTNKIPDILERYFQRVALTGETIFEWEKLKSAFRCKMDQSLKEFNEQVPTDHLHSIPNVEVVKFEEMRTRLLNVLDSFTGAPFTIQRLCELITHPQKQYKRTDKFMRGIEKNLMIVSAVDPFGNKIVSDPKPFINGLDSNGMDAGDMHTPEKKGSPFLPPPPTNSPAGTPWFNSVTPTNSPVTTGSPWHRTGTADAANSSVTSSPSFTLQSSSFGENWPDAELDDYAQSPPEKRSRLSAGNTDSMPSSSNVEPSQSSGDIVDDVAETDKSDVSGSESGVSSGGNSVNKMSVDSVEELVASSSPITSASGSSVTAVSSSSVAAVTSSECVQVSDSLSLSPHVTDSTSTTECHMVPTSTDHVQGADSENKLRPSVKTVQDLSPSELNLLPSNGECLSARSMTGTQETSEAASTDSDSASSGSDSNSSADSHMMKAEVTGSIESGEVMSHEEVSDQSTDANVTASSSEDTVIKRDSQESQGFDTLGGLDDSTPGCDSPSSPCDQLSPAVGFSSEVSSSSESQFAGKDNMTSSTHSSVHSTGISSEIHSSENMPVVSQSQHLTSEAVHTDTSASTSSSDEVCKGSVLKECQQSTDKSIAECSGNISLVPSGDEPAEPMSTNSPQDGAPDLASSSTSHCDGSTNSGQNPGPEPMDTD